MKKFNMKIPNKKKLILIKVKNKRLKKNNKFFRTNSMIKASVLMTINKIFTKK